MAGWKKWWVVSLVCLLTACMPPPGTLDRRVDGDWVAERSSAWFQEKDENGQWRWHERISYTTYFKGTAVSRETYHGTTGQPFVSEWLRPPSEMAGTMAGRTEPELYYQSLVTSDLQRNEALWPTVGRAGNLQRDRCGTSAGCRALDEQISRDRNRLDLMGHELNNMSKWSRPEPFQIKQAILPVTEGRQPAMSLEGGPPALPAMPQPTIAPQPYPGGGTSPYHHP